MNFCNKIVATKEVKETPMVEIDGVTFMHTTVNDVTVVATTKTNCNVTMLIEFLYQLIILCKAFIGSEFNENQIRKNFVLIYELLDEVMDYGLPQILEPDVLKLYITTGKVAKKLDNIEKLKQITIQATGAIPWRSEGIRYRKNEIFIDIIENLNVLVSNKGNILRTDVVGQVVMKTKLTGMPECKFGINDKLFMRAASGDPRGTVSRGIDIDDIKFHQCVRLGRFDRDRSITFVPPDGVFQLMTYRITENINLPFKIMPIVQEYGKSRIEYSVKIKSIFDSSNFASNIIVKIPVPKNTATCKVFSTGIGKAKYEPDQSALLWRIKKLNGDSDYVLIGEVTLTQTKSDKQWDRPPIGLEFQVPMFTASGLRVRYLKVHEKNNYKPTKWIRYITKGGEYEVRI
eukprot:CAMPEP_0196997066 /NCGR_PEP_ID=MMETSP1380-20130617/2783_1 /TAXON_ID=5936 /ORGANISM="Euplotes crassus, Strain CT5" /LENGTH=401 /DNA_ID=CAMNT_0042413201 /DNA_START=90 /DNA_END=1295 /DNA_ORIENTATION=-